MSTKTNIQRSPIQSPTINEAPVIAPSRKGGDPNKSTPRLPRRGTFLIPIALSLCATATQAQVPAAIESSLRQIGQIVDPACTAKLYRPLMPANDINTTATPLYPGVAITRDVSFGPNPKDVVDIFTADKSGGSRTVLLYVPGGRGDKIEQQNKEAYAFFDNIGRWGVKNGMVVVNMQRHPGANWDDGGKDVSAMIQWVESNIAKYNGNPDRMFIWAHSAGNGPLGTYIGRPELWGPKGVGVKGAIFMSGVFNILPLNPQPARGPVDPNGPGGAFYNAGATCSASAPSEGGGRGAATQPAGAAAGRGTLVDAATQLSRSSLPELKKTTVALLLASAELDPGITGSMSAFQQALHDELCKEGPAHCPTMLFEKQESHMSEVFSIDTADKTVSEPISKWMKKVK